MKTNDKHAVFWRTYSVLHFRIGGRSGSDPIPIPPAGYPRTKQAHDLCREKAKALGATSFEYLGPTTPYHEEISNRPEPTCPSCGSHEMPAIEASVTLTLRYDEDNKLTTVEQWDDEADWVLSNVRSDEDSGCLCNSCGFGASARDFFGADVRLEWA